MTRAHRTIEMQVKVIQNCEKEVVVIIVTDSAILRWLLPKGVTSAIFKNLFSLHTGRVQYVYRYMIRYHMTRRYEHEAYISLK